MAMRDTVAEELFAKDARAVLAMRRAYQEQRFGLVFGAGVSKGFDFLVPDWEELLKAIAGHPKVNGEKVDYPKSTPTARADVLFRHFAVTRRPHLLSTLGVDENSSPADRERVERGLIGEWRQLIREILYRNAPPTPQLASKHSYLGEFLEIVLNSPLTVNYNFDSYIELMLGAQNPSRASTGRGRGYETVVEASAPVRSKKGVIYHPNGYLPLNVLDRSSDYLVFSEEEFGDQLLESIAGRYSSLAYHLSKNICLFLGVSLKDENLRYFLRRNAVNNPGHYHYYVEYIDSGKPVPPERMQAFFTYRFSTYNLVTLFLTSKQIAALGRMIRLPPEDLAEVAVRAGAPTKFIYYLTGVPGIGKTTVLRQLASLSVYDEWMSDPNPLLAQPFSKLSKQERDHLDGWVALEFRKKNEALVAEAEGVIVVERAPLDPMSFEQSDRVAEKARLFEQQVVPTQHEKLAAGDVILLWGDPAMVSARIAGRQTTAQDAAYLGELQRRLKDQIYDGPEVHGLRSTDWSIGELAKHVAQVIHLEGSSPLDFTSRLRRLQETPI